ncbi:MAG: ABC transporter ATP-binding protein [Balneolales bacterium]
MIQIEKLNKRFGRHKAIDDLDLVIKRGQVTAILGPNGAGKTTLIKSMLGLVNPDSGTVRVKDVTVNGNCAYREDIGYMPQLVRYPENLTVTEILDMIRDLRNYPENADMDLYKQFNLDKEINKPFRHLSGGNKQKMSAVLAFMFRPEIMFLDEPTTGLDPLSSSLLKDKIVMEKNREATTILTSHIMSEIQELADRVIYLIDGHIHFDSTVQALLGETDEPILERAIASLMKGVAA